MIGKTNYLRWLLCVLFVLAAKQTVFAHMPPSEPSGPPKTIYVDADSVGANDGSSWADAFNYLLNALTTASPGDEIRVAEGTYKPNQGFTGLYSGMGGGGPLPPSEAARLATFELKSGVTVKGGFAGFGAAEPNMWDPEVYQTILSGDLDDNDADVSNPPDFFYEPTRADNSVNVIISIAADASAVLDGFVVTGAVDGGMVINDGSPTILNCVFRHNSANGGGAISIWTGQSLLRNCKFISNLAGNGGALCGVDAILTLSECSFTGNRALSIGGGVLIHGNAVLTECIFSDNTSQNGGGILHTGGKLELGKLKLIDCAFLGNSAVSSSNNSYGSGGAVNTYEATANNCIFSGNRARHGGAMYGRVQSIENCIFTANTAEQGGALRGMQGSTIRNSIFTGNRAEQGGGLYAMGHGPSLIGCTFSDNSAQNGNAVAWSMHSRRPTPMSMTISNCILWDGNDEIYTWEEELLDISIVYSDIQGGWPGEGNIDLDPSFAQPGYWDPNGTPDDPNDDFWIDGDYHLKSQAGRWDPVSESWVVDDITSPCIDAGNPNTPVALEPFPNGGIINMGAYGDSSQASKSPSGIHAKYGGGTGEPNSPYLIYTAEQMNEIGLHMENKHKHFKLMADIDLSAYSGTAFNRIGVYGRTPGFAGVFDGDGHTISNFTYTSTYSDPVGIFASIWGSNALIKNLGLINPNIDAGTGNSVGSLAGRLSDGTINNCYVVGGKISGKRNVGGLVGSNDGLVMASYSRASVTGMDKVGGLVGYNSYHGEIVDCYARGDVVGQRYVGGLVGNNATGFSRIPVISSGKIRNCYSVTLVSRDQDVGGLVGHNGDDGISASFWDTETSGQSASDGGDGKTTAEMQTADTYLDAGWDFVGETANSTEDIWWILEGQDYPRLW